MNKRKRKEERKLTRQEGQTPKRRMCPKCGKHKTAMEICSMCVARKERIKRAKQRKIDSTSAGALKAKARMRQRLKNRIGAAALWEEDIDDGQTLPDGTVYDKEMKDVREATIW